MGRIAAYALLYSFQGSIFSEYKTKAVAASSILQSLFDGRHVNMTTLKRLVRGEQMLLALTLNRLWLVNLAGVVGFTIMIDREAES